MQIKNWIITLKMPKKFDAPLHCAVLLLTLFGTLMIVSTSAGSGLLNLCIAFGKQMVFVVLSYAFMTFLANNFTMRRAYKFAPFIGILLIAALLSTQMFEPSNGTKAWIRIPIPYASISIQPSEFAKIFMIVIMSLYIEIAGKKKYKLWTIIRIPMLYFIAMLIAILLQKDIGTMLIFVLITACCFLIPSHVSLRRMQSIVKICFVFGFAGGIFLMSDPGIELLNKMSHFQHIAVRFENAKNPFLDPHDKGYQLINGLYGIARGGITGVGLGESVQKYGYLTQSDNDYILSIVVEETGILGLSVIVIGYFVILYRLFHYAFKAKSEGYKMILIGTGFYIFLHFVFNVGGVSGLIPLTGVPLLFISSGGSSLISISMAMGICQAVISRLRRQGSINTKKIKKEPKGERAL